MSEQPSSSKNKKNNTSILVGSGLIVSALTVLGFILFPYFSDNNSEASSIKGENLVSLSDNFEKIADVGFLLIDNGSFNAEEVAQEFSLPKVNIFANNGLSTSSEREPIYKLKSSKTSADIIQDLQNQLGIIFNSREEESFKDETLGYSQTVYRNNIEEEAQQYLRISIIEEMDKTTRWDYTNEIIATVTDWCPDIPKPYEQDFVIPGALPSDQPPPVFEELSESELRKIIDFDAFSTAKSEYETKCGTFESAVANRNVFIETSEEFLTLFGFNAETLHFTLRNEAPNVIVEAYQKIGNEILGKVATIKITADGRGVAYAEGYHYELVELGTLPTLSPADSMFRISTETKIFGIISPEISEKTTLVSEVSPAEGATYSLNSSEKIKIMVNTADGVYIMPGYLLTDTETNSSVYVVSLGRDAFRPVGSPTMD
jgi:hypothetical protein